MLVYPDPPAEPACVLLFVPVELVPLVGGSFRRMEQRRRWATEEDYQQGYRAFVELQAQLMNNCLADLIQEIRDLRGIAPAYASTPIEERESYMYRNINDLIEHVNTLIFALSGGVEHGDNVLEILRGDTEASATRNMLDLLE